MIPSLEGSDARANLDHLAGRLVTENRGQSRDHAIGAEFPFIDMEVGAADSARGDLDEQLAGSGLLDRDVDDLGPERRFGFGDRLHFLRASITRENSALEKKALAARSLAMTPILSSQSER